MMQQIDWQSIGYAQGMARCTGAKIPPAYPAIAGAEAERDYLAGYNGALHDFHMGEGYNTIAAYMGERICG